MIQISVSDTGVSQALQAVTDAIGRPGPGLKAVGELVVEFTKQRFANSKDPYGVVWAPNKPSTLAALLAGNPKNRGKTGGLSARGARLLESKKPLIGESKSLSTQFAYRVSGAAVEIRSSMIYAAMQQFGGTKAQFPNLWGDIPARPFFPDSRRGLPDDLSIRIVQVLSEAIVGRAS